MHVWNCGDRNGWLPSRSRSQGEKIRENDDLQKTVWAHEVFDFLKDNSQYDYEFELWWQASGYPFVWNTPPFGYWDLEPDGPPEPLEEGPGWATA